MERLLDCSKFSDMEEDGRIRIICREFGGSCSVNGVLMSKLSSKEACNIGVESVGLSTCIMSGKVLDGALGVISGSTPTIKQ